MHPDHLYQRLIRIYNAVHSIVYPNRAADPSKFSLLQAAYPYFSYHFSTPQSKLEHYSLELLGVSPPYQGRGIGTKLVHWGIDAADKEGVCATVTSSEGNERFYQHAGFDDIVGWATEGEGNPLQKDQVKGGAILFHWAKGEEANARSSIWKENIKAE
jgi:GNAT superfamily N-acetyltransferase